MRDCFSRGMGERCTIANELAPEHLELMTTTDEDIAAQIREPEQFFRRIHLKLWADTLPDRITFYPLAVQRVSSSALGSMISSNARVSCVYRMKRSSVRRPALRLGGGGSLAAHARRQ